jgi:SAM-dependent methyltransferase
MEESGLTELKDKLAQEEQVYAELLARLDGLSSTPTPYQLHPELPQLLSRLNEALRVEAGPPAAPSGPRGLLRKLIRRLIASDLDPLREGLARQQAFNSVLVQFLNHFADASERRAARLAELHSTLVRFSQRIDRLTDAKDRLYASLETTRADLLLEAMDKRLETVGLGLRRAEARLEGMLSTLALARSELEALRRRQEAEAPAALPSPAAAPAALTAPEYVAFENRYRGSSEEIRERLASYLSYFEGRAPVLELGSGRGEFLDLLRQRGLEGRGVDENPDMVAQCRERGLSVEQGDLLAYLEALPEGSVGGIFAAQVIEHLPPAMLRRTLAACYRGLRREGRLVLETVNPRSLLALVESFYRDLTHQKPLHPDTLDFLLRAAGFREVDIQYRSPVAERAKLLSLAPVDEAARTANENFRKLNSFLFGDQDFAAIASK